MSVTAARGFRAIGLAAGIKASGKPDVALIVNDGPKDAAAAVFTSNRFPSGADPVVPASGGRWQRPRSDRQFRRRQRLHRSHRVSPTPTRWPSAPPSNSKRLGKTSVPATYWCAPPV